MTNGMGSGRRVHGKERLLRMVGNGRRWIGAAALVGLTTGLSVPGEAITRIEESGSIGLSAFASYGGISGKSRYGLDFSSGFGLGVSLRYTVSPHWALGFEFLAQSYDPKDDVAEEYSELKFTNVIGEVFYFRDRSGDASQYFVFGLGFYRPEVHRNDETVAFPTESLVLEAGIGAEVFIRETWGLDLSGRALGYFGEGTVPQEEVTEDGNWSIGYQFQAGLIVYILR